MNNINNLLNNISETRKELLNHPLYARLNSEQAIANFMETHVYAVWDFMSLVKALQIDLTSVKLPWVPTKDNVSSSGDLLSGLLDNLGEVVGFATIAPEIPQFTRNMIDTSKLIFNGAKVKKIKDKGNLNKALDELTLD